MPNAPICCVEEQLLLKLLLQMVKFLVKKRNHADGSRVDSPPAGLKRALSGVKRALFNDEQETSRQVLHRTNDTRDTGDEPNNLRSMEDIISSDLLNGNEAAIEEALDELWNSLKQHSRKGKLRLQKQFFSLGGHLSVVQVMNKHPFNETLQLNAMAVLTSVSYNNVEIKSAFAKLKGIDAILAAMKRFPQRRQIQYSGLRAVFSLVFDVEENAALFVGTPDGISLVIRALKNFKHHDEVVFEATSILECLLKRFTKLRKLVRDNHPEVATALVKVYYKHKNNEDIEDATREALKFLMSM